MNFSLLTKIGRIKQHPVYDTISLLFFFKLIFYNFYYQIFKLLQLIAFCSSYDLLNWKFWSEFSGGNCVIFLQLITPRYIMSAIHKLPNECYNLGLSCGIYCSHSRPKAHVSLLESNTPALCPRHDVIF